MSKLVLTAATIAAAAVSFLVAAASSAATVKHRVCSPVTSGFTLKLETYGPVTCARA
jgi:hypothetical protein